MSFYYFVASLPPLALGEPAPFSLADFTAEVARQLPAEAREEWEAVRQGDRLAARTAFARDWFALEVHLRNAAARLRAARHDRDATPYLQPDRICNLYLDHQVQEAFGKANPAEREMALDQLRCTVADELARSAPFGLEAVLAYGLKLQRVERWAGLNDEAGKAELLAAVQQVREAFGK